MRFSFGFVTSRRGRTVAAVIAVLAILIGAAGQGVADAIPASSAGCSSVELVGARGSGEPPGLGPVLSPIASPIASRAPVPVTTYGLEYPAVADFWDAAGYAQSLSSGVGALRAHLTQAASRCPAQRFVLLGFSQGANVVGDTLAGSGSTGTLPPDVASRIAAVLLFGDPRFTAGEPFNTGGSTDGISGMNPRPKGGLAAFADRIQSYCHSDDSICQVPSRGSTDGHHTYGRDTDAAVGFALAKISGTAVVAGSRTSGSPVPLNPTAGRSVSGLATATVAPTAVGATPAAGVTTAPVSPPSSPQLALSAQPAGPPSWGPALVERVRTVMGWLSSIQTR